MPKLLGLEVQILIAIFIILDESKFLYGKVIDAPMLSNPDEKIAELYHVNPVFISTHDLENVDLAYQRSILGRIRAMNQMLRMKRIGKVLEGRGKRVEIGKVDNARKPITRKLHYTKLAESRPLKIKIKDLKPCRFSVKYANRCRRFFGG